MEKILWYLLFLIVWGTLSRAIYIYQRPERRNLKAGIWDQEILALYGFLVLYLPVLLLAKFSSLLIAGAYLLGAQIDILVTAISGEYTRRRAPSQYLAEALWASMGFYIRKPAVAEAVVRGTVVLEVTYPIVAGIVYFSSVIPSETATLALIRVTLLMVFIGETLISLVPCYIVILCENLSSAARRRFFVSLSASIVPLSVIVTTFLWTFSSVTGSTSHSTVTFRFMYSPKVLVVLAVYFAVMLVLPYLIGVRRGNHQRSLLNDQRKDRLFTAIHILRIPVADSYAPELSELVAELNSERQSFVEGDKSIKFGLYLDKHEQADGLTKSSTSPLDELEKVINSLLPWQYLEGRIRRLWNRRPSKTPTTATFDALKAAYDWRVYYGARSHDLRFQYLHWLESYVAQLTMTSKDLEARRAGSTRVNAARAWADSYEGDRRDLSEKASEMKTDTLGAVVVSTAVTTVASVFFTGFGSWLWTHASHNLPK